MPDHEPEDPALNSLRIATLVGSGHSPWKKMMIILQNYKIKTNKKHKTLNLIVCQCEIIIMIIKAKIF